MFDNNGTDNPLRFQSIIFTHIFVGLCLYEHIASQGSISRVYLKFNLETSYKYLKTFSHILISNNRSSAQYKSDNVSINYKHTGAQVKHNGSNISSRQNVRDRLHN